MSTARYIVGDVFEVLASIKDQSVNSVITSPPYWRKRRYVPNDHPLAALEIGQEGSPGAFLATMLRLTDELHRVVRDDGTIWINLGDTASGSGGAGGDYNDEGWREGQNRYAGSGTGLIRNRAARDASPGSNACRSDDMPRRKSVCWIPELFGASLAYGHNLLTGEPCKQWITRPPVTWCKPSVTPGEIIDKFREATELIVWAAKQPTYYFDLDAVRLPPAPDAANLRHVGTAAGSPQRGPGGDNGKPGKVRHNGNPLGPPPLNWWKVNTSGYEGAHFATFPAELIIRPVIVSCPPGGTILDPFGGSGTVAAVATGHDRNCISIDFDERNAHLATERCGMFITVEHHNGTAA